MPGSSPPARSANGCFAAVAAVISEPTTKEDAMRDDDRRDDDERPEADR
jgi:hypothetical protein